MTPAEPSPQHVTVQGTCHAMMQGSFCHGVDWIALRVIVYLILEFDLSVGVGDVKVALLESFMQESDTVFVHLPEGCKALLVRFLYGCKQSGRNFCKLMRAMFEELGYHQHPYSLCIYMDLAEDPEDFVLVEDSTVPL